GRIVGIKSLLDAVGITAAQVYVNTALMKKYCLELIDEFGLLASKPSYIPMQPNISLSSEPKDGDPLLENSIYAQSFEKSLENCIKGHQTRQDVMILEEAEYGALASVTSEVIWILKILKDFKCYNLLPVKVFCDNNSAIKIVANLIYHERTKHLEIDLLGSAWLRVITGSVKLLKVEGLKLALRKTQAAI
ncbi:ribonuclease H-like domain-containing protein, partial [Tanacetum coccineum]